MKTFKEYISDQLLENVDTIELNEESDAPTTQTAGVANPDARPVFNKSVFRGHPCLEVDDDTYNKFIMGKRPFARWAKYVECEDLRSELKNMFTKNKKVLVLNAKTGSMVYAK